MLPQTRRRLTHHRSRGDASRLLIGASALVFGRTTVFFRVWKRHRRMPLLLGFALTAMFIWFAENIGTGMNVWRYPSQAAHWTMVPVTKLEAWYLLVIVSYTLVSLVSRPQPFDPQAEMQTPLPVPVSTSKRAS